MREATEREVQAAELRRDAAPTDAEVEDSRRDRREIFARSGFPSYPGADAWIEGGRAPGHAHELFISLPRVRRPFWLEWTSPTGTLLGWTRFEHVLNLRNRAMYAATELRPARDPAPPPRDVWLRSSTSPLTRSPDAS